MKLRILLFIFLFLSSTVDARVSCHDYVRPQRSSFDILKEVVHRLEPIYEQTMMHRNPHYLTPERQWVPSLLIEPYRCRTCRLAPFVLLPLLQETLPKIEWRVYKTENGLPHFRVFHAYFVGLNFFGKGNHLIVDPSLRQLFWGRPLEHIPKIFVGSVKHLDQVLRELEVEGLLEAYLYTKDITNSLDKH